ncbi:MAG: hypothetical protein IT384_09540 [Deltaproteobacteria bacterium]|nr:hypothetical protein [Deltaproteobacteria bacterium]
MHPTLRPIIALSILTAAACESGRDVPDGGGVQSDAGRPDGSAVDSGADSGSADAAGADVGRRDGGGPDPEGAPILERTPRQSYDCRVTRAASSLAPRRWSWQGHSLLATTGGQRFLARVESMSDDPFTPGTPELLISTLALDATFGANPARPSTADPSTVGPIVLARRQDAIAAVWVEGAALRFTALDASGALSVAAKDITGARADSLSTLQWVEGQDGFGLLWQVEGQSALRFVPLTRGGDVAGASVEISRASALGPIGAAIAPLADGYAIVWQEGTPQRAHVWFKTVDAAGVERTPRVRLSVVDEDGVYAGSGSGFSRAGLSMLPIAGGFLVAWAEVSGGDFSTGGGGYGVIRIAKVDGAGTLASIPAALRAKEEDVDEVEPVLFNLGTAAGVAWSRGSHIYACGGCMPDHRIDLVLLDPSDLVPVSNVVSIPPAPSGLLGKSLSATGADLLATFHITYHVHFEPGSAALTCD